jgi:hypothetical protein
MALDALELLDPTAEQDVIARPLANPLRGGAGSRIGLVDIRKPRGDVFLDEIERLLRQRNFSVLRMVKPTFTRPASIDLRREIAERCDAVIEALAD